MSVTVKTALIKSLCKTIFVRLFRQPILSEIN